MSNSTAKFRALQVYHSDLVIVPQWDGTRHRLEFAGRQIPKRDYSWSPATLIFQGHTDTITWAEYSSDNCKIVSSSVDQTVRVWDAISGVLEHTLTDHTNVVNTVAFSPDTTRIVSSSRDKTIRVWDTVLAMLHHTLVGHTNSVSSAAFSSDGQRIVSGSHDTTARVWDAVTGMLLHTLVGHLYAVSSAAFSPDGLRIVTGSHDQTLRVWDATSAMLQWTLSGHTHCITSAMFSFDGLRIVSSSHDDTLRLWDVSTGSLEYTIEEFESSPHSLTSFFAQPQSMCVSLSPSVRPLTHSTLPYAHNFSFQGRFIVCYMCRKTNTGGCLDPSPMAIYTFGCSGSHASVVIRTSWHIHHKEYASARATLQS
jgi:WD40 repeat protein